MMDILTKLRVVELNKLYDAMVQFRFTRVRLKRYGYREPEPSQLFETLRTASSALSEKDSDLHFRFQHYIMKHSSVNGLVNEQTVQEMYDMIVENSRRFLDTPSSMDAKALPAKGRDRTRAQDQAINKGSTDYGCYGCGSSDHWIKDCPWKQAQNTSQQGTQFCQNLAQPLNLSNKNHSGKPQPRTQSQRKRRERKG